MKARHRSSLTRIVTASLVALAACRPCAAASSTTELGTTGQYFADSAAPDNLTTTKPGATLKVTDGSAVPLRPADLGVVRLSLSATSGPKAVFTGRTTDWGCAYTVNGVYVGSGATPTTWTSKFDAYDNPRIVLEVNGDSVADDVILLGGSGWLRVWVLGASGNSQFSVDLSAVPSGIASGLPQTVSVTAGESTPSYVTLGGLKDGEATIVGTAKVNGSNQIGTTPVKVLGFRGTLTPTDNFTGRSLTKVGVGETGTLGVEGAGDTTDVLRWSVASGTAFRIDSVTDTGTATFTAGDVQDSVNLKLTDTTTGESMIYPVNVIIPSGAYQVIGAQGRPPVPRTWGAYMFNYTYLLPKDVSFSKIQVIEGTCPAQVSPPNIKVPPHPAWPVGLQHVSTGNINTGCLVLGPNPAGLDGTPTNLPWDFVNAMAPLSAGAATIDYDIPWQYSIGAVQKQPMFNLLQHMVFTVDNAGQPESVTVYKGGVSTTQSAPW